MNLNDKCGEWLTQWCIEYNIGRESIHWMGFVDLTDKTLSPVCGDNTIGLTRSFKTVTPYSEIYISKKMLDKKLFRTWRIKSVLWHEFCHAYMCLGLGKWTASHGEEWKRFRRKKFWLVIGDF